MISSVLPVLGPPSPVRLCGGCLRRFGDLRKNTPYKFGACILRILSFVNDFRAPKPFASVSQLPAVLRLPQKKTRPWIFGVCVLRILSFLTISGPPKPFAAVSQLPAALRLPKKNTPLEFWSMYLVDFVDC